MVLVCASDFEETASTQLLVESVSRMQLQAFLKPWVADLRALKSKVRWTLEVDPVDI